MTNLNPYAEFRPICSLFLSKCYVSLGNSYTFLLVTLRYLKMLSLAANMIAVLRFSLISATVKGTYSL